MMAATICLASPFRNSDMSTLEIANKALPGSIKLIGIVQLVIGLIALY